MKKLPSYIYKAIREFDSAIRDFERSIVEKLPSVSMDNTVIEAYRTKKQALKDSIKKALNENR